MNLLVISIQQSLFCWPHLCRMPAPELHVIFRAMERNTTGKDLTGFLCLAFIGSRKWSYMQLMTNSMRLFIYSSHIHWAYTIYPVLVRGWDISINKAKYFGAYILIHKYLTMIFRRIMRMEIFSFILSVFFNSCFHISNYILSDFLHRHYLFSVLIN